jgi:TolB-like protein
MTSTHYRRLPFLLAIAFLALTSMASAQLRVAVLPFRNMDGAIKYNPWCQQLSDSLTKELLAIDPAQTKFMIIPADSIEMAISELNLDPTNPQYESDVWKAVKSLKADRVIQGNFFMQHERVLLNAYIFDPETKMSDPAHQAKNLYKSPETILEVIKPMARKLHPGLVQ